MQTIFHILTWLLSAVSGTGFVFILTNFVKISDLFPFITPGQTTRIRTVAALLSAISTIILAVVNPDIRPEDLQSALVTIGTFAVSFVGAHLVHKATK